MLSILPQSFSVCPTKLPHGNWRMISGSVSEKDGRRILKENRRLESKAKRFIETEKDFYNGLTDYFRTLRLWKEACAPKTPEEEWDERFCEALLNLSKIEYVLDYYLSADTEEKIDVMKEYGGMVLEHKRRNQNASA